MAAAHLVFIPFPGAGHFFSAVELAKLLLQREPSLSVTVLTIPGPEPQSLASSGSQEQRRLSYVHLSDEGYTPDTTKVPALGYLEYLMPQVRDILVELTRSESTRLSGVVVDMLCAATFSGAAKEMGVPSYIFFTSGAGFLCLAFHALEQDMRQFKDSDAELTLPGYVNPVPAKVLPSGLTDDYWSELFLPAAARFKEAKGILVNTFYELQPRTITCLLENDTIPPIYPVGPILNLDGVPEPDDSIISWLNNQPQSSVLFLCFGSTGSFDIDQVIEISRALETTRVRFLWSLRQVRLAKNYENVMEVLPEGFLGRTCEIGKVIGWAPQVAVLSHPAVGGFFSHCGWNSILESLWFGVPLATWPHFGEQQINGFELVKELGLAVELKLDYKKDLDVEANYLVTAVEIEKAIRQLMEPDTYPSKCSIKQKVKEMSKKSRMAIARGGSSYDNLDRFIEGVIGHTNKKRLV